MILLRLYGCINIYYYDYFQPHPSDPSPLYSQMFQGWDDSGVDPTIAKLIREAQKLRQHKNRLRKQAYRPRDFQGNTSSHGCPDCARYPLEERCVLVVEVTRNPDILSMLGSILTCAPDGDRIPFVDQQRDHPYIHPDDIGLKPIRSRPHVFARCGRDVFRLVEKEDVSHCVGVVVFQAWPADVHATLIQHHNSISAKSKLKRSNNVQHSGDMIAKGTRVPSGGYTGDGYVLYKDMSASTDDDIEAMFYHAWVSTIDEYVC